MESYPGVLNEYDFTDVELSELNNYVENIARIANAVTITLYSRVTM